MKKVQMVSISAGYLVCLFVAFWWLDGFSSPRSRTIEFAQQTIYLFAFFFPVVSGLLFLLKKLRSFWLYVVVPMLLSSLISVYVAWMSPFDILSYVKHVFAYFFILVLPYLFFGFFLLSVAAYLTELTYGWFLFKTKGKVDVWEEIKRDFRSPVLWIFVLLLLGVYLAPW